VALSLAIFLSTTVSITPANAEPFSPDILASVVSLLPQWPGDGRRPKEPEGTAVAVLPGGYLVTNDHVIGRAKTIHIRLNDGRVLAADIIGRDAATDIALIKAAIDLPVLPTGPEPVLGARVCAVGNQFGLGLSVTCGVASAVGRTGAGFNPVEDFIQTDAVINPGGSGGALVDGKNRLIGLVSAIFTKDSDANIGVNFAASIKLVMRVARDLKNHGRVAHASSGLNVRDLTLSERRTSAGALVHGIAPDGPAAKAGLKAEDIITNIGGRAVRKASDVATAVFYVGVGNDASVEYRRDGAREMTTISLSSQ